MTLSIMTLSITTFSIMTLSIIGFVCDTQHNNNLKWVPLSWASFMLSVAFHLFECWMSLCWVSQWNVLAPKSLFKPFWLHFHKSKFTFAPFKASPKELDCESWICFKPFCTNIAHVYFFYSGLWCSTKTNKYGHHTSGNWGICSDSCPTQGKPFKLTRLHHLQDYINEYAS